MEIGVIPQYKDLMENEIFNNDQYSLLKTRGVDRPGFSALKSELEERGHSINTIDQVQYKDLDLCIFHDINHHYLSDILNSAPEVKIMYMMFEAPSYMPFNSERSLLTYYPVFDQIITWNDQLAKRKDRIHNYNLPYRREEENYKQRKSFEEKDLLVNISSRKHSNHPNELYSSRKSIVEYYDKKHPNKFNLYGYGWDKTKSPRTIYHEGLNAKSFKTYQGLIDNKFNAYHKHKFSICFENQSNISGWITEKIFDCFRGGTVPIYWGADNISEYIPENSFIDYRDFLDPEDLHEFISSMDKRRYDSYLQEAQEYLDKSDEFTPNAFATRISNLVESSQRSRQKPYTHLVNEMELQSDIDEILFDPSQISRLELIKKWVNILTSSPEELATTPEITLQTISGCLN